MKIMAENSAVNPQVSQVSSPKSSSTSGPVGSPEKVEGFYERIMRLGYGPPDGDKLDRAGWRRYFHEMHDVHHHKAILDVFGHLLPKEWKGKLEQFPIYFLDGIDKDLTSTSRAFSCCPRYQYIHQNGYGPPDGHKLDFNEWSKYLTEMPPDKRKKMSNDLFRIPQDPERDAKLYQMYSKQVDETQGFDVDVCVPGGCGTISPVVYDDMSGGANADHLLHNYSKKALDDYNGREGSDYTVTRVVKACVQCAVGRNYYITFEGINSKDHLQVFQAQVYDDPLNEILKIMLVRPKPEKA